MASFKIGKVIIRNLFRKPATLMYPAVPRKWRELTRGHIEVRMEDCILCGICARKCPTGAIAVDRGAKTWAIERMQCVQCSCCVEYCPKKCLANRNEYTAPETRKIRESFEKPAEPDGI
jgi:formate hydrogenlyase subunit 6/NADH:ubiquinone oxidoreductase subunit I